MRSCDWLRAATLVALALPTLSSCGGRAWLPVPDESTPLVGTWKSEPAMLHTRSAHNVVATAGAIYALAGTGAGNAPVLEVERFDGETWTVETTLPGDGLNAPASAVLDGKIYVVGGFSSVTNVPSRRVLVYDLTAKSWSEAAPLPAPRGGHGIAVLDGRIHVFGGGNSKSTIADHAEYDPGINAWTERAPLPRAEGSPAGVVLGTRIYAIGGRSGAEDFGDVYVYDPKLDTWKAGPAIVPRGTAGAVAFRGAIHVFGGESQAERKCLASVLRLDPATAEWTQVTELPTARNYARAVLFNDGVYVVGGSLEPGFSHSAAGSALVESYRVGVAH